MSKVADFVKRMEKQGRQLEVNGNFVVISPTNGLEMSDLIEMQNLNKKCELADYISKQLREGADK
ncbi:TPA: hypothetical protein RQO71_001381 [Klebsiella michiganensis]|nr:hypothetical protein [Klebsiella michiganensis]